jgi:type IV secretory pathway protease TraF
MTRKLAIAALAAAAVALEAAFMQTVVAAPLSNAVGTLAAQARPATYTETVVVQAPRAPRLPKARKA